MTREPDLNELVGGGLPPEEEARLRRAHELLVAAGPVPELPPGLEEPSAVERRTRLDENVYQLLPRRRVGAALALAAAIALVAFLGGYVAGFRHDGFAAQYSVQMHSAAGGPASAAIEIGTRDSRGNWPLRLEVSGLPKLKQGAYYEMFLTRGTQRLTCGTFTAGGQKTVKVRLNAPYDLRRGVGWIVTKERPGRPAPGPIVLTT
jgi:Anti-sigma-K factor rskA